MQANIRDKDVQSFTLFNLTSVESAKLMPSPAWTINWQLKPVAFRTCWPSI